MNATPRPPTLTVVDEKEHPQAHAAWAAWRRYEFGSRAVPKKFTVPSMFPPTTQAGADAYAEQLRVTRESIGWHKPVNPHPKPWSI